MKYFNAALLSSLLMVASAAFSSEPHPQTSAKEIQASPFQVVGASVMDDQSLRAAASGENIQCFRRPQHGTLLKKLVCRPMASEQDSDKVLAH